MLAECGYTHIRDGNSPDLEVVRSHEEIGETLTHHTHDPLIEVLWLVLGVCSNCDGMTIHVKWSAKHLS